MNNSPGNYSKKKKSTLKTTNQKRRKMRHFVKSVMSIFTKVNHAFWTNAVMDFIEIVFQKASKLTSVPTAFL